MIRMMYSKHIRGPQVIGFLENFLRHGEFLEYIKYVYLNNKVSIYADSICDTDIPHLFHKLRFDNCTVCLITEASPF